MDKDQTTTPGTTCPTLYDECVGSLTSPASHYSEDAGDGCTCLMVLTVTILSIWSVYKEILNDYSYKTTKKYVSHRLNPKSNNMPGI